VAEEIRKLAIESAESVKNIEEILLEIKASSSDQNKIIEEIQNIVNGQKEAAATINSSIQELYAGVNVIVEHARSLSGE